MKHLAEFQRCNLVLRLSHLPTLSHQQGGKIRDPGNKVATVGVDQKGPGSIIDILWDIEALNFFHIMFLNSMITKLRLRSSFLILKRFSLKLRMFLIGCIVAMVNCNIKRMTTTCLPVVGH